MKTILVVLLIAIVSASAEDTTLTSWSVRAGYSAYIDELNIGLLYTGGEIGGQYAQRIPFGDNDLEWRVNAAVGVMSSRGLLALDIHFTPVDGAYLFRVVDSDWQLFLGPGVTANYRWYLNPDQQSGHFFWYTHYDLEFRAAAVFTVADQRFRAHLHTTVASLASRPPPAPDPYFYDWNFGSMISKAHSDLEFGSYNLVQHIELALEWMLPGHNDLAITYTFVSDRYQQAPTLETIQHSVGVTWY